MSSFVPVAPLSAGVPATPGPRRTLLRLAVVVAVVVVMAAVAAVCDEVRVITLQRSWNVAAVRCAGSCRAAWLTVNDMCRSRSDCGRARLMIRPEVDDVVVGQLQRCFGECVAATSPSPVSSTAAALPWRRATTGECRR